MDYADIIVDISREELDHTFTYRVPAELKDRIRTGSVVKVPFGSGARVLKGYVVSLHTESALPEEKLKDILEVVTDEETADAHLVALSAWMSRTYGSTTIRALKTVLPLRKKIASRMERRIFLKDRGKAEEVLLLSVRKNYQARVRALQYLLGQADETQGILQSDFLKDTKVSASVIHKLDEDGIITISVSSVLRQVKLEAAQLPPDSLTEEQKAAAQAIREEWKGKDRPVLLEGVTGSGKTLVYMELIADILREGRQAIVLIPEIALTHQTVLRFIRRFGDRVSFMHSRLSEGERYDQMKAARSGRISIMVGPRSALFAPFSDLGIIVIDEEHEETYHSEQVPRYHAVDTAIERAKIEHAHVILGSATPSLSSAYRVRRGEFFGTVLSSRFGGSLLPETKIIDMREELAKGNRSIFSDELASLIRDRLRKKEQVMLFLNRRGYAGNISCRFCGHVIKCPHCDVSLTRHKNGRLICHYCGYEQPDVRICPKCGSKSIGGFSIGTEQVEETAERMFPEARILRMDADTTKGKEGHSRILTAFGSGEADILIGTQMIVKGHDFPEVTLVGVLMADLSLNESDFRSQERTYSLITQAVGRAGRGRVPGMAVIQTYHPEHYAIRSAAAQDYNAFYKEEIAYRTILGYPPTSGMTAVLGSAADKETLQTAMAYLKKYIDRFDKNGVLKAIGPAPCAVGRIKDRYRQVIYIRNTDRELLIRAKDAMERYIQLNSGFRSIDIQFDVQ
jgi:primosomal protein N' (replication factor Y)